MTDPFLPEWAVILGFIGFLMCMPLVVLLVLVVIGEFRRGRHDPTARVRRHQERAAFADLYPGAVPYASVFDVPAYLEKERN